MSRADCVGPVLGGLVIAAVLVLAGCQEAPAPNAAKPSIEGGWTVLEYVDTPGGGNYADAHDMTLTFTDDTWVWTFDPPLPGVSEAGAAAVLSGSYELLSDSRMLFIFERPIENQIVTDYLAGSTALVFELKGHRWLTARRM